MVASVGRAFDLAADEQRLRLGELEVDFGLVAHAWQLALQHVLMLHLVYVEVGRECAARRLRAGRCVALAVQQRWVCVQQAEERVEVVVHAERHVFGVLVLGSSSGGGIE